MPCDASVGATVRYRPGRTHALAEVSADMAGCESCGGSGWLLRRDERGYDITKPCELQVLTQRIELFNRARIPARYYDRTLDNFEPRVANHDYVTATLERFVEGYASGHKGPLFFGQSGTGKTHLAVALLRKLTLDKGISARFVDFFELLSEIREAYGTGAGEASIIGPLTTVPVLCVDELGKGKGSDWELSVLDQLIGVRYNRNLTTLFTTNYPLRPTDKVQELDGPVALESIADLERFLGTDPLEDRVGYRAYSRILEMCRPIALRGASDYRLRRVRDQGAGQEPG